jgi:hypothetical protein
MKRPFVAFLLILLLASPGRGQTGVVAPVAQRDWATYPAIKSVPMPQTLYALGDVHGDYDRLSRLLVAAGITEQIPTSPTTARWSAGKSVLICTGDIIDKYTDSLSVIALMRSLQGQASAAGGEIVVTLGNHEAEFLASDKPKRQASEFSQELIRAGLSPGDVVSGRDAGGIGLWLRNLPCGARVGDWFFCHAGNTGGMTVPELEKSIEEQVGAHGWAAPILSDPNSMLEARMHPRPWWDWDGSEAKLTRVDSSAENSGTDGKTRDDSKGRDRLLRTVTALGAKHLVFGHQPGRIAFPDGTERAQGEMYCKYDGLVFLIDTGMSRGVQDGRGAVLRIESQEKSLRADAIYIDGSSKLLWRE